MIVFKTGNIFKSECQTLVNTVNCVGVMGAGIAKQFKQRYPKMFEEYKIACKPGQYRCLEHGGDLWLYTYIDLFKEKKILCFATKEHWMYPSKIEWIERGLKEFVEDYKYWNIKSIAWPKLGCTNGKLDWETQVKPLMFKYLQPIDIICEIYE